MSILENERPITLTCYSRDPKSTIVSIVHAGRWNGSFLWADENTAGLTRNRVGGYWRITPFDGDICTITYIDNSGEHYLYADGKMEGCGKRRYVRLSMDGRPPKDDPRAYWQIVPKGDGDKRIIIHAGTFKGEYLYNKSEGMGGYLRTWKGLLYGEALGENQALWRISNVPIQKRSNTGKQRIIWGHAEQEIQISADGLTVTDTAKNPTSAGGGRYRPVLCEPGYSKGRHTWNVKANSAGRLEVGVSSSGFNVKGREGSALNNQSCGWCICVYEPGRNMTLWHAGRRVCYPSFKWQVGSILNVILDCDAHTLEFRLNGKAGSNFICFKQIL